MPSEIAPMLTDEFMNITPLFHIIRFPFAGIRLIARCRVVTRCKWIARQRLIVGRCVLRHCAIGSRQIGGRVDSERWPPASHAAGIVRNVFVAVQHRARRTSIKLLARLQIATHNSIDGGAAAVNRAE